jgi:predicted phosphodiesterase
MEALEQHPDASKLRLAKILYSRHPSVFSSVETARGAIRYVTGAQGKKNLERCTVDTTKYEKERAGSKVYSLPKSKAKPWLPHTVDGKCVAIFSDCHFPKHDEAAIEAAVTHVKSFGEVDTVLLNGDFADAEEFSSWAKSPKAIDTENTLEIIRQGLLYFRGQFPNATIVYKLGNHEERLERFCWSKAPELVGLEHITWKGLLSIDNELNKVTEFEDIVWVGEQRPVMLGKLPVFHGHELPKALTNSVNPARGAFLKVIDTVLVGHFHRSSSHVEYNWKHQPINCWSLGCLCDLTPEYMRLNRWNWGMAVVEIGKSGSFDVHNFKLLEDKTVVGA